MAELTCSAAWRPHRARRTCQRSSHPFHFGDVGAPAGEAEAHVSSWLRRNSEIGGPPAWSSSMAIGPASD